MDTSDTEAMVKNYGASVALLLPLGAALDTAAATLLAAKAALADSKGELLIEATTGGSIDGKNAEMRDAQLAACCKADGAYGSLSGAVLDADAQHRVCQRYYEHAGELARFYRTVLALRTAQLQALAALPEAR